MLLSAVDASSLLKISNIEIPANQTEEIQSLSADELEYRLETLTESQVLKKVGFFSMFFTDSTCKKYIAALTALLIYALTVVYYLVWLMPDPILFGSEKALVPLMAIFFLISVFFVAFLLLRRRFRLIPKYNGYKLTWIGKEIISYFDGFKKH